MLPLLHNAICTLTGPWQLDVLSTNLQRADGLIASCPACRTNFYNLFCTFTCSPDQSTFVNVTQIDSSGQKPRVTELDQLWPDKYGSMLYDSCKEVKFGPTNSPAMDLIGGGAKNFTDFLKFLGDKKPFGSPFQINFPRPSTRDFKDMVPAEGTAYPCDSEDPKYRCSCVDCANSCPELPAVQNDESCHVGAWPCLTFAVVLIYALSVFLMVLAITGHIAYRKHKQSRNERLRLLQDTAASDDEDDADQDLAFQFNQSSGPTRKYWLNSLCDRMFTKLGRVCAQYPAITISVSFCCVALLSLGWIRFDIEKDPVRLWVSPDSAAAQEKQFFDSNFGPFFRAEQAFLVNDTSLAGPGPVLSYETLRWWFDVEGQVARLKSRHEQVSLKDICFNPTGDGCVVQSVPEYFKGDFSAVNPTYWQDDLDKCLNTPADEDCRPFSGAPIPPNLVLGGGRSAASAQAIISTWVVNNGDEGSIQERNAMDWEEDLKNLLKDKQAEAKERGLRLSFNTEISLEQELNKSTNTDAKIVVVSYIVMFIYASLALGSTTLAVRQILRSPTTALVQSKFMLGVVGIVIVLFSVSASVGLFSAMGVKVTLIIAEVIPFLVLAIGVDNIFLIVHEFERVNSSYPHELIEERLARALGHMGPSILLSATMETVAFALGAFVGMPAVRNFAVYAAGAVVINALLQVTMFVAALALNQRRVEAGKADCVPCITVRPPVGLYEENAAEDSGLQHFIRRYYAPALLGRKTKLAIVTVFLGLFTAGIALLPSVKLGLDQRVAIPEDSYLINYFNDLYDYFETGPPVYFVSRELNATARQPQQQLCGRFLTCDEYSLSNILEQERKRPETSYLAGSAASWLDDMFLWLNPATACCVNDDTETPCFEKRNPPWNITMAGMPEGEEFIYYLKRFLSSPAGADCPLGGQASYSNAVVTPGPNDALSIPASHFRTSHTPLRSQDDFINAYRAARRIADDISSRNPGTSIFPYSKFYVFFDQYLSIVPLSVSLLAGALAACLVICTVLLGSLRTGLVVAGVVTMTIVDIAGAMAITGVSLNALTLVNLVISVGIAVEFCAHIARAFQFPAARLLADASAIAAATTPTRASSTGLFSLLGPKGPRLPRFGRQPSSFTAARLVSLPSITARQSGSTRDARAWAALTQVGGSVFTGITVTKLLGVAVLAFSRSKIFEMYYFRVWLSLVILAALHALVFLPVALSLLGGPEGWRAADERTDNAGAYEDGALGVQEDLRRRMRGGRAAYADDDESDDGF